MLKVKFLELIYHSKASERINRDARIEVGSGNGSTRRCTQEMLSINDEYSNYFRR